MTRLPLNVNCPQLSRRVFQLHSSFRFFQIALPTLAHIYLVLLRPIFHCSEVTALVVCAEVWIWVIVPFDPVHGYQAHISVAHELLSEEIRTMI